MILYLMFISAIIVWFVLYLNVCYIFNYLLFFKNNLNVGGKTGYDDYMADKDFFNFVLFKSVIAVLWLGVNDFDIWFNF